MSEQKELSPGQIAFNAFLELKDYSEFLSKRWNKMTIDHKIVIEKTINAVPSITLHLAEIFDSCVSVSPLNSNVSVFNITEKQAQLLMMLALPNDEDEFIYREMNLISPNGAFLSV